MVQTLNLERVANGLKITVGDKEDFLHEFENLNTVTVGDILEAGRYLGNNWYDLTGSLALTDAPIIGYDIEINDKGDYIVGENDELYFFNNYMIENPWETLANTGEVFFQKA